MCKLNKKRENTNERMIEPNSSCSWKCAFNREFNKHIPDSWETFPSNRWFCQLLFPQLIGMSSGKESHLLNGTSTWQTQYLSKKTVVVCSLHTHTHTHRENCFLKHSIKNLNETFENNSVQNYRTNTDNGVNLAACANFLIMLQTLLTGSSNVFTVIVRWQATLRLQV